MSKIFLICPVRKADDEANKRIEAYNTMLELEGNQVHWPKRDTQQDGDPIGIRICRDNREAMFASDEVHVWYDPESRGSCFDLGMAQRFSDEGRGIIEIANPEELSRAPRSPQLSALESLASSRHEKIFDVLKKRRGELTPHVRCPSPEILEFCTIPTDTGALLSYGYIFAMMRSSPQKVVLCVEIAPTPEKSFNNVLLYLAEETRDGPRTV